MKLSSKTNSELRNDENEKERKKEVELLKKLLNRAIKKMYDDDLDLIVVDDKIIKKIERSMVFRIGTHLNDLLKGKLVNNISLDSEYNKHIGDIKRGNEKHIRPDLILHKRGIDSYNKMVIEFKGWWNKTSSDNADKSKLRYLTSKEHKYQYLLGVFVKLNEEHEKVNCDYFENGEKTNKKSNKSS